MKTENLEQHAKGEFAALAGSESRWLEQTYDKLEDLDATLRFRVRLVCADCGEQLNITSEFDKKGLRDAWTHLVTSSGLVARACPKGCRSTFSDLNINTRLLVEGCSQNVRISDGEPKTL